MKLSQLFLAVPISFAGTLPALAQGAAAGNGIETVTVTATLRTENAQDVPVTVTAVSPDLLNSTAITDDRDLQLLVPSLTYTQGPSVNTASLAIRGVGTESTSILTEESVSLVVDGVVQGIQGQALGQLTDINRVEVLEGPQGMLFGKNASAGVVNIVTNDPALGQNTYSGHFSYASYNDALATGVINLAVGDDQAMRVDLYAHHRDGLIYDVALNKYEDDDNSLGGRLKYLWQPDQDLKLVLAGDFSTDHGTAGDGTIRSAGPGTRVAIAAASLGITPGPNNIVSMEGNVDTAHPVNGGASLTATYNLNDYTITSITAWREYNLDYAFDPDGSPAIITEGLDHQTEQQKSEELRLASPNGGFIDYVAGLFYFRKGVVNGQTSYGTFNNGSPPLPANTLASTGDIITGLDNTSYAAFGRATLHFTDKFSGIVGARYTVDDYIINNRTVVVPQYVGLPPSLVQTPSMQSGTSSKNNISWQIGFQYQATDDLMGYFTASRGYKGPVPLQTTPTSIALSLPEVPMSYEVGVKSEWLDHTLLLNLTAFHAVYKDFQAAAFDFQAVPPVARITNAGSLLTQGLEFAATTRPLDGLTISSNVDYLDAHYLSFNNDSCYLGQTLAQGCVPTGVGTAVITNSTGHRLSNAPDWTATLNANYIRPIDNDLSLYLNSNYFYKSSIFWTSSNDPFTHAEGYGVVGLSAGVGSSDEKWKLSFFVKNLFDQRFAARIQDVASAQAGDAQQYFDPEAFRYIGVSLDLNY